MVKEDKNIEDKDGKSIWKQVIDTVRPFPKSNVLNQFKSIQDSKVNPNKNLGNDVDYDKDVGLNKSEFYEMFKISAMPSEKVSFVEAQKELKIGDTTRLNRSQARQLLAGKLNIDAVLDLHGNTQIIAFDKVFNFIETSYSRRHRKIKIITGKGKGILQNEVPKWLNRPELSNKILSITHAQQKHGGSGALYILLKRDKD